MQLCVISALMPSPPLPPSVYDLTLYLVSSAPLPNFMFNHLNTSMFLQKQGEKNGSYCGVYFPKIGYLLVFHAVLAFLFDIFYNRK